MKKIFLLTVITSIDWITLNSNTKINKTVSGAFSNFDFTPN